MKIVLTKEELKNVIHTALCNGLVQLSYSDIHINVDPKLYDKAKYKLKKENPNTTICLEDIYCQILYNGDKLHFIDEEGDENASFDLEQAETNLSKEVANDHILAIIYENDDACNADAILQICLYGEVIFG